MPEVETVNAPGTQGNNKFQWEKLVPKLTQERGSFANLRLNSVNSIVN